MKLKFSKIFRDLVNYLLAGGLARLLPFLLLPYIARILTPENFGLFSLYRLYIALGSVLLLFGVDQGLFRLLPEVSENKRRKYLSSAVIFVVFVVIVFSIISWPWHDQLNKLLLKADLPVPFFILPLLILVNGLSTLILTSFSAQQQSKRFLMGNLLVQVTFFLLFLAGLQAGWQLKSFFVSFLLANLLLLSVNGKLILFAFQFIPELHILKQLLKTGLPLMFLLLLTYLLYQSDHYIIKFYLGVEQTGVYNYGYRFASMLLIFVVQSNNVWLPRVYARGEDFFKQHFSAYASLIALACAAILWFLVLLFHYFSGLLIPSGFEISKQILLIVGLGYIVYGQAQMIDAWLILKHKSRILVWISMIALILNISLNLYLIPRFGLPAAALVTSLSFLFIWLAILIYLKQVLNAKTLILSALKTVLYILPFFLLFFNDSPLFPGLIFFLMAILEIATNPLLKTIWQQ